MKLYVLPVELRCQGSCAPCITKFRGVKNVPDLSLQNLERVLNDLRSIESIEITGGGEPTRHEKIVDIVNMCSRVAPTQMYTHGMDVHVQEFSRLSKLCLSRWHDDDKKNEELMGVQYDIYKFVEQCQVPIKLSVVAQKGGIETIRDVMRYILFASSLQVSEVVVRQLFSHEQDAYKRKFSKLNVSVQTLAGELFHDRVCPHHMTSQGNPVFRLERIFTEFEFRSCACETENPVLHADGRLTKGWTGELYDFDRERNS